VKVWQVKRKKKKKEKDLPTLCDTSSSEQFHRIPKLPFLLQPPIERAWVVERDAGQGKERHRIDGGRPVIQCGLVCQIQTPQQHACIQRSTMSTTHMRQALLREFAPIDSQPLACICVSCGVHEPRLFSSSVRSCAPPDKSKNQNDTSLGSFKVKSLWEEKACRRREIFPEIKCVQSLLDGLVGLDDPRLRGWKDTIQRYFQMLSLGIEKKRLTFGFGGLYSGFNAPSMYERRHDGKRSN